MVTVKFSPEDGHTTVALRISGSPLFPSGPFKGSSWGDNQKFRGFFWYKLAAFSEEKYSF
jgi:hypothetical protein